MKKFWIVATILIAGCGHYIGVNAKENYKLSWTGVVSHVSDGDTLWVRPSGGGEAVKIRIDGIDAPEICQAYGSEAQQALRQLVLHQAVQVRGRARDSYGRLVAQVQVQQADIGQRMVASGHAWAHSYRSYKSAYGAQQNAAQRARIGLFAGHNPQNPRDFRKQHGSCKPDPAFVSRRKPGKPYHG